MNRQADIQRRFVDALYGRSEPGELLDDLTPSTRHRAVVYAEGLRARFSESLSETFPKTAALLGAAWENVVTAYAFSCPSMTWDLGRIGDKFPDFLSKRFGGKYSTAEGPPWLTDLARLEKALHDTFFIRDDIEMGGFPFDEDLLAVWKPRFSATLSLLSCGWPIGDWLAGGSPIQPRTQTILVFRAANGIGNFRVLSQLQATFQSALLDGAAFNVAAERADLSPAEIEDICSFWVSEKLLRRAPA